MADTTSSEVGEVFTGAPAIGNINDAHEALDNLSNRTRVVAMADADADMTATESDGIIGLRNQIFKCEGANTDVRSLIMPNNEIRKTIWNNTTGGNDVQVEADTIGAVVLVPAGEKRDISIRLNGGVWDVEDISSATGSGGGTSAANKFVASLGGGELEYIDQYDLAGIGTSGQLFSDTKLFDFDPESIVLVFKDIVVPDTTSVNLKVSTNSTTQTTGYVAGANWDSSGADSGANYTTIIARIIESGGGAAGEISLALGSIEIIDPTNDTTYKHAHGAYPIRSSGQMYRMRTFGAYEGDTDPIDGVFIETNASTITSGTMFVYRKNSTKGSDVSTGGVWQFVEKLDVSAAANLDAGFTSERNAVWKIEFEFRPDTDDREIQMQISNDNAVSYEATGYDWGVGVDSSGGSGANFGANGDTKIKLNGAGVSNVATEHGTIGTLYIQRPAESGNHKAITWSGIQKTASGDTWNINGSGSWGADTSAITNLRFFGEASSNITGNVSIYKKSLISPTVLPVGGAVSVVQVETVSAANEVDFTREIDDNGAMYLLVGDNITVSTDNAVLDLVTSTDGSTWDEGVSDYRWVQDFAFDSAFHDQAEDNSDAHIQITKEIGNDTDESGSLRLWAFNPSGAGQTDFEFTSSSENGGGNYISNRGSGRRNNTNAIVGFRVQPSAGTFSGTFTLYKFWNHERRGESNPALMSNRDSTAKIWTKPDGSIEFYSDTTTANTLVGAWNGTQLDLISSDPGNVGHLLRFFHDSASPAIGDTLGRIEFVGRDDGAGETVYGRFFYQPANVGAGTEDGDFYLEGMRAGSNTSVAQFSPDFHRLYIGGSEALRIDSGSRMLIGHTLSAAAGNGLGGGSVNTLLSVYDNAINGLSLFSYATTNSHLPLLSFNRSDSGTVGSGSILADGAVLGGIIFNGDDGVDFATTGAKILAVVDGTPAANQMPSELVFYTAEGASADDLAIAMTLKKTAELALEQGTRDNGFFNFVATADADTTSAISTLNTSGATTDHIQILLNGTKAWIAVSTNAPT